LDPNTPIILASLVLVSTTQAAFPWLEQRAAGYRHLWIPFCGGIALGYVALYMLPKLTDYTLAIRAGAPVSLVLEYRVYLFVLAGLLAYLYAARLEVRASPATRVVRASGVTVYSLMVGYLLVDFVRPNPIAYILAGLVMALHFVGVSHAFRERDQQWFDSRVRWLLPAGLWVGAGLAAASALPREFLLSGNAFLAGVMLMAIMTEEVRIGEDTPFAPFLSGAGLFLLVTLVIRSSMV
jgi:hypothetical protein